MILDLLLLINYLKSSSKNRWGQLFCTANLVLLIDLSTAKNQYLQIFEYAVILSTTLFRRYKLWLIGLDLVVSLIKTRYAWFDCKHGTIRTIKPLLCTCIQLNIPSFWAVFWSTNDKPLQENTYFWHCGFKEETYSMELKRRSDRFLIML